MPITHGWTTAEADNPAYDVSADELNTHTGTNDHAHTATGDGGVLTSPEVSAKLLLNEQGSDPASPSATKWVLYVKSGGVYAKNSAGTVVGPLAAGGASFATPTIALGSAAAAGAASTVIRSDATIAAFDATAPTTQAFADAAAVGSAAFASRRDHKHGMMALPAIDATGAATDITTRNVSTTAHGLAPKLPNDATKYLDGTGLYSVPSTTGGTVVIKEVDGAPTVTASTVRFPNGTLTDDGGGQATYTPAAGGMTHSFIGYNTIGGASAVMGANKQYMTKVTLAAAGLIASIGLYTANNTVAASPGFSVGVLADSAGSPTDVLAANFSGNMLINNDGSAPGIPGWVHVPVGLWLPAGDYWLTVTGSGTVPLIYHDTGGSDLQHDNTGTGQTISDGRFYSNTNTTFKYSIRASFIS